MGRVEVNFNPGGLGTTIQLICTFLQFKKPVLWIVSNPLDSQRDAIKQIIKIFKVPESQLAVQFTKKGIGIQSSDTTKFFSPYINVDSIFVKDAVEKVDNTPRKRFIGLCLYGGRPILDSDNKEMADEWPYRKMWPIEVYLELVSILLKAGYDVISLDSTCISIEDKVHLMNNYCDAVIGYEGGIHHLAHLLKIPSIILPWNDPMRIEYIHSLHLDTRTFYVESIDDISKWDSAYLETLIYELKRQRMSNNYWFGSPISFTTDLKKYWIERSVEVVNYGSLTWMKTHELQLLIDNLKDVSLGGIIPITYKT